MEKTQIKDTVLTFLRDNANCTAVLATTTQNNAPHAATVYYFADSDLNFYFLTATKTRKYENLLTNPKSSIVVGFGPSYVTIQTQGYSELLEKGSTEEAEALVHIKKRLLDVDSSWPVFQVSEFDKESIAVFKFTPESLYLLNLEENNGLITTTEEIKKVI